MDVENFVKLAAGDQMERKVPPDVDGEPVLNRPCVLTFAKKRKSLVMTTSLEVDMSQAMSRPQILRVDVERL